MRYNPVSVAIYVFKLKDPGASSLDITIIQKTNTQHPKQRVHRLTHNKCSHALTITTRIKQLLILQQRSPFPIRTLLHLLLLIHNLNLPKENQIPPEKRRNSENQRDQNQQYRDYESEYPLQWDDFDTILLDRES